MKLNRANSPKVYTSWKMPRSEFEARLDRERRRDEMFKILVPIGLLLFGLVLVAIREGL